MLNVAETGIQVTSGTPRLTLTGQHDRSPVTTKHEKRSHANHLFATFDFRLPAIQV
jgi:hypothetical protein